VAAGDEITSSMWLNFALAVGTAVGVFIVPNHDTAHAFEMDG
jgi:hypothetical protein